MRHLMLGDIVGRAGRELVLKELPRLKSEWKLDCIVVNADNAAGGFGVLPEHCHALLEAGADVLTGGDHVWDQKGMVGAIDGIPRLLRPLNYPGAVPGRGAVEIETVKGKKILVLHVLGQVFIKDNLDCPFAALDKALASYRLGGNVDAILVDGHAEATSEKCAFGVHLDGRVSAVAGSHTHIPTADERILPGGTAYQTDMGMCGDYNSVIGFQAEAPMQIFTRKLRKTRMEPAKAQAMLCGLYIETDDKTGLASRTQAVRIGQGLQASASPV